MRVAAVVDCVAVKINNFLFPTHPQSRTEPHQLSTPLYQFCTLTPTHTALGYQSHPLFHLFLALHHQFYTPLYTSPLCSTTSPIHSLNTPIHSLNTPMYFLLHFPTAPIAIPTSPLGSAFFFLFF